MTETVTIDEDDLCWCLTVLRQNIRALSMQEGELFAQALERKAAAISAVEAAVGGGGVEGSAPNVDQ